MSENMRKVNELKHYFPKQINHYEIIFVGVNEVTDLAIFCCQ